jgi:hypothetical protein
LNIGIEKLFDKKKLCLNFFSFEKIIARDAKRKQALIFYVCGIMSFKLFNFMENKENSILVAKIKKQRIINRISHLMHSKLIGIK